MEKNGHISGQNINKIAEIILELFIENKFVSFIQMGIKDRENSPQIHETCQTKT